MNSTKIFQPQLANYSGEMRFSEIVFVGFGITDDKRDDYKDIKVAGKLVVVLDGVPEGYTNSQPGARALTTINGKMTTAMNKGAVALIVVNTNFPRTTFNAVSNWSMNSYKASNRFLHLVFRLAVAAAMMGEDGKNIH
ncbi:MAG: PA domain-containing protein [Chitinophagaceae bacterium]